MLRAALLATALLLAPPAFAVDEERSPDAELLTSGFLYAHPDLKHRFAGLEAYEEGDFEQAYREFRRSSRWADKMSQAMVAEMLWTGQGTEQDRSAAYAWMDLAAQRGYPSLVALRERYWSELSTDERERALEVGKGIYEEFDDAITKERLYHRIRRERTKITGSRTGFVGALSVMVPSEGGWKRLDGSEYYDEKYWVPEKYFEWQDRIGELPPAGIVRIGPLERDGEDAPAAQPDPDAGD